MRKSCVSFASLLVALAVSTAGAAEPAFAQERGAIRGTVTDAQTGEPISGAQVAVRGTSIGTLTNNDGRYVLTNIPTGRLELRVEYIGYSPQQRTITVPPGATATEDFQMGVAAIELEELVATGYAQQTRREISSAISSVGAEEVRNTVVASLDAALQGRAAGVQVIQNAGNPGNGITVRVRGSASITASNQPLYVVDGVPIYQEDFSQLGLGGQDLSAITGLNPDEIESIDILKDAAAAAIYGSRGSNGVIMITTKRGAASAGRPQVQVSVSAGYQEPAKLVDMLSRDEWLEQYEASIRLDGYWTEEEIAEEMAWFEENYPDFDTNWVDEVTRTAPISNSQVAISGGTERFKYYVSGSYFDQTGIIIGSGYDRGAGRVNLDFQMADNLTLAASVALSQEDNDRIESDNSIVSAVTNAIANEPWTPVKNPDGSYNFDASYSNPVATGLLNEVNARTFRSFGNLTANYGVLNWLQVTGRAGFDIMNLREYEYQSPEVLLSYAAGVDGVAQIGNSQGRKYVLESYATGAEIFGPHDVSVTVGGSVETNDRELSFARGEGFTSAELHWPRNAARPVSIDGTSWQHNLLSAFARLNYTLADRYVVNASIRRDGSSRFGDEERFGIFPAISGAWLASNESFMSGMDAFFSDLRFRASWGITGNEAIGDFQFLGLYGTANYGDIPGTAPDNLANSRLKWERTHEWNLGVDMGLFGDRLGIVGEYYKKDTEDLLLNRPVTSTSGFESVLANVGSIENKGWEASLRTVNVRPATRGGFEWITEFNITRNENTVTGLFNDEPFNGGLYSVNRVEVGQPLGAFHLNKFVGVDDATGNALYAVRCKEADARPTSEGGIGCTLGEALPDTTTLSPTSEDRFIVGSPHPDYYGGIRNVLSYGPLDLSVFVEFSQGAEIYNAMRRFADDGFYYWDNKFADTMDYWRAPGDETDTPRPSYYGESGARLNSSRFVEDASYVRLQDVTLGFDLPGGVNDLFRLQNARLYVTGKNLKTWTDYSGFSPDVNSGGSSASLSIGTDFYAYPIARAFTIGFQGTW